MSDPYGGNSGSDNPYGSQGDDPFAKGPGGNTGAGDTPGGSSGGAPGTPGGGNPYGGPGANNPYGPAGGQPGGFPPPPPAQPGGYGAPPPPGSFGGYGAPAPFGNELPPKTDGVSIASLVTALLCCTGPVAVVLGIVGIRRTKGGQRKGRGLAVAGLVIGVLATIGLIGGGIAIAVFAKSAISLDEAQAGQCFNTNDDNPDAIVLLEKDCTEKHDGEIIATTEVTADNLDAAKDQSGSICASLVADDELQQLDAVRPRLDFKAITETPDDINVGDHIVCYVTSDTKLTAPVL